MHDRPGTDSPGFASDLRVGRILDIFAKETGADRARPHEHATLEELGVASLDLTMAVFQIEEAFDIQIPLVADRPGAEFRTVAIWCAT